MSFRKLSTLLLIAGSILALSSCKKDEDTESIPSLGGTLTFQVDAFVAPNTVVTMSPKGLYHPKDKGIGYYWKVTPDMDKADTTRLETGLAPDGKESDGSFTYKFRDSLATYTVTCYGFAKGYSGGSSSVYVNVVKPGLDSSLTKTGINSEDAKVTVDGIDYYYVSHNGLDWMRNNLANPAFGAPYASSEVMSNVLGRFYSYTEASKACPEGWRLPSDKEWTELAAALNKKEAAAEHTTITDIAADLMADAQFNLQKMWEYWPEVGDIKNTGKLAVIPSGYANLGEAVDGEYPMASFTGIYEYAAFWTNDTVDGEDGMAYYRYLICDQPDMYAGKGDVNTFGASVRCVRESAVSANQ